jgi:hypothetical protein
LTLTDPKTGAQESISYQDASVLAMWKTIGDTIAQAVFAKLIADGKLPAGTLATVADPAPVTTVVSTPTTGTTTTGTTTTGTTTAATTTTGTTTTPTTTAPATPVASAAVVATA